jgi:hypothetical protein
MDAPPVRLAVLSLLSPRCVVACMNGRGVYRFDCDSAVQGTASLARATPAAPVAAVGSGRLEWDFSRGAFAVGGVAAV